MIKLMNETGIGYAGIEGVWWLPAVKPFSLPPAGREELGRFGPALFAFFDAVSRLYEDGYAPLVQLLDYKVPPSIRQHNHPGRVDSFRPDFQLVPDGNGSYRLALTEIECCPAAHGFAHAMQVGYGLETDLAAGFARYLDGRSLLFAGTHQWSQFIFEQLAFCRALAEHDASGLVLYDLPVAKIAADVRLGHRWQPPMFGIPFPVPEWDNAVGARIYRNGLLPYLRQDSKGWPEELGEVVVFRFGYMNTFTPDHLAIFNQWQNQGTFFLNPTWHILDSKALLAALPLPDLRRELDQETLAILDAGIPESHLLTDEIESRLLAEKDEWVLKFAGFDEQNKAWGGQSLVVGRLSDPAGWQEALATYQKYPWPVIAQRYTHTAHVDMDFLDAEGQVSTLYSGRSRLRAFYLRGEGDALGAHLTVSGRGMSVSESINSVQAPVNFVEPDTKA